AAAQEAGTRTVFALPPAEADRSPEPADAAPGSGTAVAPGAQVPGQVRVPADGAPGPDGRHDAVPLDQAEDHTPPQPHPTSAPTGRRRRAVAHPGEAVEVAPAVPGAPGQLTGTVPAQAVPVQTAPNQAAPAQPGQVPPAPGTGVPAQGTAAPAGAGGAAVAQQAPGQPVAVPPTAVPSAAAPHTGAPQAPAPEAAVPNATVPAQGTVGQGVPVAPGQPVPPRPAPGGPVPAQPVPAPAAAPPGQQTTAVPRPARKPTATLTPVTTNSNRTSSV
ncbi:nickel transporter, partial [Streptomyces sp. WI03-4A]|nr:nickel transporter [Streptomyces sp. WI03-4A]